MKLRPSDAQPGDRIVGMSSTIAKVRYIDRDIEVGGSVDGQRWAVELADGRTVTYAGDSWLHVIRGEAA